MSRSEWKTTLFLLPWGLSLLPTPALGQILPDNTLPNNSIVIPEGNRFQISGGTEAGSNLFHSFSEFSIPTGNEAFFNNSPQISNIFSRITGESISTIDGLIRANGTANLFLINPNGIIFGPNAKLNIGGSFFATTADSLNFADGTQFSATNPQAPPLLTINVPVGLQFGATPGQISVQGQGHNLSVDINDGTVIRDVPTTGLEVRTGKTLALVGSGLTLEGGNLTAQTGRIELGSVAGNSAVSLNSTSDSLSVEYEGIENFQNIELSAAASVDVSGEGSGNIQVQGQRVTLADGSVILGITEGENSSGMLSVNASESLELSGLLTERGITSALLSETQGEGNSGNLNVSTGKLIVLDGSQLSTSTAPNSTGQAGNLSVTASESVELSGFLANVFRSSGLTSVTLGSGRGGDLTVTTGKLIVRDGAEVTASTFGAGDAGNVLIRASEFVEASGTVEFPDGRERPSGISAQVGFLPPFLPAPTGDGGNLTIDTQQLRVFNGALISTGTSGAGDGGSLTINASQSVEVMGRSPSSEIPTLLTTQVNLFATGNAGDLTINTGQLVVRDGGAVSATTLSAGDGGTLRVNASESVELSGVGISPETGREPSGLFARSRLIPALEGLGLVTGNAGNLIITTNRLTIKDGAEAAVSSGLGSENAAAGTLRVNADEVRLDNGVMTAETRGGIFGNIVLNSDDIQLRRNSQINTDAQTTTGGNITIDTDTLVALENSDITANAREGVGGRVIIETEGIFGTEFRDDNSLETSDITATSALGPRFSGIVEINGPEVDPRQGLEELDDRIIDVSRLIDQNLCSVGQTSQFGITGRGGLPSSPYEPLTPSYLWEDPTPPDNNTQIPVLPESPEPIIEAQGFTINPQGKIALTANPENVTPHAPWLIPTGCSPSRKNLGNPLSASPSIQEKVLVKKFEIEGSTVFDNQSLADKLEEQGFVGELTFGELIDARSRITQRYLEENYLTSGAYLPEQTIENGIVKIKIVEGKVAPEDIQVTTNGNLKESYIKNRLKRATQGALNQRKLIEELQLLQLDPLIARVQAELSAGIRPGTNFLNVDIIEANQIGLQLTADNGRVPSVGSFRRGGEFSYGNILGLGDRLLLGYTNTEGSNTFDARYNIPLNARNSTLEFSYRTSNSDVIEPPFDRVDIEANSRSYELTFREPLVRTPREELAIGLTASRRESDTSILGIDFPLSPGANDDGETKLSVLSFFQDWTKRGENNILAIRSEFNLGVGWFDATINSDQPDSRFFAWRGQAQWVRELADDTILLVRGNVQLTPTDLVPLEEFGLGGLGSVRGYRQDALLADNGAIASVEAWLPIMRFRRGINGVLQLTPFVDIGAAWNSDGQANPDNNVLVSTGVGLQLRLGNQFTARLDWGIPLVDLDSRDRTWQENGIYFSITSSPF